jgi:hypothetical protein
MWYISNSLPFVWSSALYGASVDHAGGVKLIVSPFGFDQGRRVEREDDLRARDGRPCRCWGGGGAAPTRMKLDVG